MIHSKFVAGQTLHGGAASTAARRPSTAQMRSHWIEETEKKRPSRYHSSSSACFFSSIDSWIFSTIAYAPPNRPLYPGSVPTRSVLTVLSLQQSAQARPEPDQDSHRRIDARARGAVGRMVEQSLQRHDLSTICSGRTPCVTQSAVVKHRHRPRQLR